MKDARSFPLQVLACSFVVLALCLGLTGRQAQGAPAGRAPGEGPVATARGAATDTSASPAAGRLAAARVAIEPGVSVGEGALLGNLQLFPIFSTKQESIGEFTTLPLALRTGQALVQEQTGDGEVDRVAIHNKGKVPIVVLAGTIIKGGKQDRQIGQDFIIGARQRVAVDAFCVEQGRWEAVRGGVPTGGSFSATGLLTMRDVRVAGEFRGDQGEVWSEVAKVNRATGKQAPSGTLMATVDDQAMVRQRTEMARQAKTLLLGRPDRDDVVGLAYAIDGQVQGVRWFAHRELLREFSDALLETAAMEALAAAAKAQAAGRSTATRTGAIAPALVAKFISARKQAARRERRATAGSNENEYRFSDDGYSSQTRLKASPQAPARPVMEAAY